MNLRPVDVLTLAYFGAGTVLVCVGHKHVSRWYEVPLSFGLASLVIVVLAVAHGRRPGDSRIAFLRLTYPLLAMAYIYVLAGRSALAIHGRYLDTEVNSFELSVFGDHPNLVLDRLATQPLTELMMAGYVLYYAFFLVPPLILLAQRRRHELERYVFTLTFVLYVCFVGFSLVPLVGPALSLSDSFETRELSGYLATGMQHFIASFGDPPGACWPSAHVAGAWAALLSIRQAFGTSALWATLPVTVCITIAVVYCRYHYASDALAGLVVTAACYPVAVRLFFRIGPGAACTTWLGGTRTRVGRAPRRLSHL